MGAKEYLQGLRKIETQIKNKCIELKWAQEFMINNDPIMAEIDELNNERLEIIRTIERLPEAEYDVLHKVYVQHKTLYEVASERDISYSLATTIHGKALKHLDKIIKDCI